VSRLQLQEPDLAVNSERAIWFDSFGRRAYDQAFADLDALDCSKRGTCLREALPSLDSSPMAYFAGLFALAGLVAGTISAGFGCAFQRSWTPVSAGSWTGMRSDSSSTRMPSGGPSLRSGPLCRSPVNSNVMSHRARA
jgi:hypothetical protein